jgi:hypothetical protein
MKNNDTPAQVCHSMPGRSRCRRQTADTAPPLVHDTVDGYNFSDGAAKSSMLAINGQRSSVIVISNGSICVHVRRLSSGATAPRLRPGYRENRHAAATDGR